MKFPLVRSLLFGCLAMMAAVFTVASPAAASEYLVIYADPGGYDEQFITTPAVVAVVAPETVAVPLRTVAEIGPVHPVYDLSRRTNGHSLQVDPHLRV